MKYYTRLYYVPSSYKNSISIRCNSQSWQGTVASTSNPAEETWHQLFPCHVERSRDISYVISTKRSTWSARLCRLARPRNLSATNTFSNLLEMHAIYRNFSLFYLEVNKLFAIFATEKYGTGSLRFTLFLLDL